MTAPAPVASGRRIEPPERHIVHATDLGGVEILKHGDLYLLTDPFGDIHLDSRGLGLYLGDTRILSSLLLRVNDSRPTLLRGDSRDGFRGTIQLTNPALRRHPGNKIAPAAALSRQSLGIARHRLIGRGLRERIVISNFTEQPERLTITLALGADMADIFEVRGHHRPDPGRLLPIEVESTRATFAYEGRDRRLRRTFIVFPKAETDDRLDDPGAAFRLLWMREIEPGGRTELEWTIWTDIVPLPAGPAGSRSENGGAGSERSGGAGGNGAGGPPERGRPTRRPRPPAIDEAAGEAAYRDWLATTTAIDSDHELFDRAVARSLADLRLLVNDGPGPGEHYVAAGIPWFSTLFGRDAIITAFETVAFRPQLAAETLRVLAARQATRDDPGADAEPGKIVHELRTGEMAATGEMPFGAYYGSADATPLWLVLLGETFDWTGDRQLLDDLWPHALAALEWIDRYGDLDGDGFVEYRRRAPKGLINQGWKDSSDSVRFHDGRVAAAPIALVEVQGYVHDAKLRLARLARTRGDPALAERLESDAARLRDRFEQAYWVPARGAYAMALDREKRPADADASNVGHALWSGVVSRERAAQVAARLTGERLDSGWGIRTLAAGEPGYNPLGYHTGSVWPHDNAIAVAGLKRYGFDDLSNGLATCLLEAAEHAPGFRLPELFCGFDRREVGVPVPYPVACSPQAWSAAAPLFIVRTMLGLRPDAAAHSLELVRPHLPTWLGKLTLTGLRVGDASLDLLFHRWRGSTAAEVLRRDGQLDVTIRF